MRAAVLHKKLNINENKSPTQKALREKYLEYRFIARTLIKDAGIIVPIFKKSDIIEANDTGE